MQRTFLLLALTGLVQSVKYAEPTFRNNTKEMSMGFLETDNGCQIIKVGSKWDSKAPKNVKIGRNLECPAKVDITNWKTNDKHKDKFITHTHNGVLTVTRMENNNFNVKRSVNAWGMPLAIECCDITVDNGCELVKVGSKWGRGAKNVKISRNLECPAKVDKNNWKTHCKYNDKFTTHTHNGVLTVTRMENSNFDVKRSVNSWGMHLAIECCAKTTVDNVHKQIEARRLAAQHAEQAKQYADEAKKHGGNADKYSQQANKHQNAADAERQNAGALYKKASQHAGNAQRALEAAKALEQEKEKHYKKAAEHLKRASTHQTNAQKAQAASERLKRESAEHGKISEKQKALAKKHHNSFKYSTEQMEKHEAKADELLNMKVIDVCLRLRKEAGDEAAKAQGFAEEAKDVLKLHKQSKRKSESHRESKIQKLKDSVINSKDAEEQRGLANEQNGYGQKKRASSDKAGQEAEKKYKAAKSYKGKSVDATNQGDAADKRADAHEAKADAANKSAGSSRAAQQKAADLAKVGGQPVVSGGQGNCFTKGTDCHTLGKFCVFSKSVDHCAPDCGEISKGKVCGEYKGCSWDAHFDMCDNEEAVHESEIRKHKKGDANGNWLF